MLISQKNKEIHLVKREPTMQLKKKPYLGESLDVRDEFEIRRENITKLSSLPSTSTINRNGNCSVDNGGSSRNANGFSLMRSCEFDGNKHEYKNY
ncbi:hypothetical protein CEXT_783771 [Caerostris extrusa]|uniref:Ycf1 n=1 Tax=Caerostris extrusa TaxID=172846 RepID=A0AAV4R045_CAEEX|nr:hypothetical protein CEXT_783771 [Caerostris extrusa]